MGKEGILYGAVLDFEDFAAIQDPYNEICNLFVNAQLGHAISFIPGKLDNVIEEMYNTGVKVEDEDMIVFIEGKKKMYLSLDDFARALKLSNSGSRDLSKYSVDECLKALSYAKGKDATKSKKKKSLNISSCWWILLENVSYAKNQHMTLLALSN